MDRCGRRLDYSGAKMRLTTLLKKRGRLLLLSNVVEWNGIVLFDQENDFSAMNMNLE
jgi:hypothetical protein